MSSGSPKYVFVSGGVVSALGKGIVAASLGRLLKARGLRVQLQKFDPYLNVPVGYGSRSFNNTGCGTETVPINGSGFLPGSLSKCTADTRVVEEGTAGFWYRVYQGAKGRIQWGPQVSYVDRYTWSGENGLQPHGVDFMVFTSFRYYLP